MVQKIGGLIAFSLLTLTMLYIYRQFTNIYSYVESSEHWRYLAATLIVGAMGYSLMLRHALVKFAFWGIVAALGGSVAINAAIPLNLINYYPPLWNIVILLVITGGTVFAVLIIGVGARHHLGTPLLVALGDAPRLTSGSESGSESNRKSLPKPTETKGLLGFMGRVLIQKPKEARRLSGTGETDSDGETTDDSESETNKALYDTLNTLATIGNNGEEGSVSAAAARLGCSRTWVNEQLKELYKIDPESVEESVPNWVKRNIGTLANL